MGPGVTATPMLGRAPNTESGWLAAVQERTPLGRLGTAEDIAQAIRALHDVEWMTGQIVECDGGLGLHSPIDAFGENQRGEGQGCTTSSSAVAPSSTAPARPPISS